MPVPLVALSVLTVARPSDLYGQNVSPAGSMLDQQWVRLDGQQRLSGVVREWLTVVDAQVRLTDAKGKSVVTAEIDASGRFHTPPLRPGLYTLIYASDRSIAAYVIHACPSDSPAEIAEHTMVAPTAMAPKPAWERLAADWKPMREPVRHIDRKRFVELIQPRRGIRPEVSPARPADRERLVRRQRLDDGDGLDVPFELAAYRVFARADGRVPMRFYRAGLVDDDFQPAEGTWVTVYQSGKSVTRLQTDRSGRVIVEGLSPGSFEVLAAGEDGFAVTRFNLWSAIDNTKQAAANRNPGAADRGTQLVAQRDDTFVADASGICGCEVQLAPVASGASFGGLPVQTAAAPAPVGPVGTSAAGAIAPGITGAASSAAAGGFGGAAGGISGVGSIGSIAGGLGTAAIGSASSGGSTALPVERADPTPTNETHHKDPPDGSSGMGGLGG